MPEGETAVKDLTNDDMTAMIITFGKGITGQYRKTIFKPQLEKFVYAYLSI